MSTDGQARFADEAIKCLFCELEAVAERIADISGDKPDKPAAQLARLHQALQPHLNEMFFSSKIIFVEGLEDVAYITSWLVLSNLWDEFRRHGAHIVPANGKSHLVEPIVVAQFLNIPVFVVFDADGNIDNPSAKFKHEKDNKALLGVLNGDNTQPFPTSTVWDDKFVQWPTNLGDVFRSEVEKVEWDKAFGEATKGLGNPEGSFAKNTIHIGDHIALLHKNGNVPASLDRLCKEIMKFVSVS